MLSDRIFPRRSLSRVFIAFSLPAPLENTKPTMVSDNRPAKKNRLTRRASRLIIVLIISVTQSTRRCRALASRHPSELLDSLVSVCRRPSSFPPSVPSPRTTPTGPYTAVVVVVVVFYTIVPLCSVRVRRPVTSSSSRLLSFLSSLSPSFVLSESNCGIVDDRPSKFNN